MNLLWGSRLRTEYWWNRYIGFDITEYSYDLINSGSFWTNITSCNKWTYKIEEGVMDFAVLYEDAGKVVVS